MAYLEIRGQRHLIGSGETPIGCDANNVVALGGELRTKSAILQGMPDGQVAVKNADADSEVFINGIKLGPQPTPLLHGDKIEIAGQELLFVDDRRSGSTEYIKAVDPATLGEPSKPKSKGGATAGTGGRLVSLTDGREYEISGGSVLIGRDAGCDIVLSAKNVSRRHAEVVATPRGYILIDNSTNGTLVNNKNVKGQHVLSRADVIRCGDHEFRFYADAAEMAEAASAPAKPETAAESQPPEPPAPPVAAPKPPKAQASKPAPPPTDPPAPAKGAEQRLAHTMHGIPAMPRPGQPPAKPTPQGAKPPAAPPPSSPATPKPKAAKGAEQRLAHTMHGIPAMPRPGQDGQPAAPPPGAQQRLQDTLHGVPEGAIQPPQQSERITKAAASPPRPSGAPKSLASLLVRSGSLKGQRVHIKVPIVNIGRAEYNDVVLPDDSVSTVHAKLQRREGIWVVVDLESTNGTIVDGERVDEEAPLAPGAIVRFGTIQTIFEPTDDSVESQQGGGTQVLQSVKSTPPGDEGGSENSGSGPGSKGRTSL
jgi:pSer/pThr/pTyr-binding forkhead associated (FHA) protein